LTRKADNRAKKVQIVANWDNFKLETVADVRLFLAFTLRHMMQGKTKIPKAKAAADLARAILKTHELPNVVERGTEREIASVFAQVVSSAASSTTAYDYQSLPIGQDPVQDGARGEAVVQDGMGEETPGE
jgi:hypothetical protein